MIRRVVFTGAEVGEGVAADVSVVLVGFSVEIVVSVLVGKVVVVVLFW